jgi:hypothetical protein
MYRLLRDRLESGDVFVAESIKFKSFEEDLISREEWKSKDVLIQSLELPFLHQPIDQILASLEQELEQKLKTVNDRIKQGVNSSITITTRKGKTIWKLPYKKAQDEANHNLYQQIRQIGIGDIMHFVNTQCGFLKVFTHILSKDVRSQPDECSIMASMLAQGLNIGLFRMAEISDMTYAELVGGTQGNVR